MIVLGVVATEIFDDTGRPHTLEHLIFLGSKNYPYKGVLDNLANRAGGDGTNAWTADDRECLLVDIGGRDLKCIGTIQTPLIRSPRRAAKGS